MSYNFESCADRQTTNAEKYALREALFGTKDVLPAWVADMDIETPDFVLRALKKRLEHPVIGYEEIPQSAYDAQIEWMKEHHGVAFRQEDMFYSHSVVASIHTAITAFSEEGEGVIVQTPVYPPFFHSITELGRKVVKNPLKQNDDGKYSFDIEDLEAKIESDTKLLLLCSPHNPVGRVWLKEELEALLEVCERHNIIVFADEIHSDLVFAPHKHTPFVSLNAAANERTLTAIGPGKTFNMAGFAISNVAIRDAALRERFEIAYKKVHYAQGATLSHVAFENAYREGKKWHRELLEHLWKNYMLLENFTKKYEKYIKITPLEATYLAWIDCRGMQMSNKALQRFFIEKAKLGLNPGLAFGREGSGFMRLNFAVSTTMMHEIIARLESAFAGFQDEKQAK